MVFWVHEIFIWGWEVTKDVASDFVTWVWWVVTYCTDFEFRKKWKNGEFENDEVEFTPAENDRGLAAENIKILKKASEDGEGGDDDNSYGETAVEETSEEPAEETSEEASEE